LRRSIILSCFFSNSSSILILKLSILIQRKSAHIKIKYIRRVLITAYILFVLIIFWFLRSLDTIISEIYIRKQFRLSSVNVLDILKKNLISVFEYWINSQSWAIYIFYLVSTAQKSISDWFMEHGYLYQLIILRHSVSRDTWQSSYSWFSCLSGSISEAWLCSLLLYRRRSAMPAVSYWAPHPRNGNRDLLCSCTCGL